MKRDCPGIDDLVAMSVCNLYLLTGFDEGGCSAARRHGLNRGSHVLKLVRCHKVSLSVIRM